MKLSKRIALHRELWTWLAENPKECKSCWPGWKENGGHHEAGQHFCFMPCDFAVDDLGLNICNKCYLVWPKNARGEAICCKEGSLFWYWLDTESIEEKISIANQIANLPVKEQYKGELELC